MTVKEVEKAYSQIDLEKKLAEEEREKLKPRCSAMFASIVGESRTHNLDSDDFQKILLALLKDTEFEGATIVNDGINHIPTKTYLASSVYQLGSRELSYKVWFEKYGIKDPVELHFSQVVRPN